MVAGRPTCMSPRTAAITTIAHELTHVWQYGNWAEGTLATRYGAANLPAVYEGMASWVEIQYLLFVRDFDRAQREEYYLRNRDDIYGDGFRNFVEKYPLRMDGETQIDSPFSNAFPL